MFFLFRLCRNTKFHDFFTIKALLVPPNPKEFDKKALIFLWMVLLAILRFLENSSGVSKLMLGAINHVASLNGVNNFACACHPTFMSGHGFCELISGLCVPKSLSIAIASKASPWVLMWHVHYVIYIFGFYVCIFSVLFPWQSLIRYRWVEIYCCR